MTVTIRGTDSAPSFGTGSVSAKTFIAGAAVTEFQAPAATGGNGAISYAASGLPAGLRFDATGSDSPGCPGTEPREICGTPTAATSGARTVTITAADADSNTMSTDRTSLTFSVTVNAQATLASSPATLTVTLPTGFTFAAGVSAASFQLVTNPALAGLSISGVTGGATGTTAATLTLAAGAGYGFDAAATLAVRVLAAAHSRSSDLTTGTLPVTPSAPAGVTVSRTNLALDEDPGAGNANQGTYTVVLNSATVGCSGGVGVSVASGNPDVTVDPTALAFTAANWDTAQTMTVTAQQDDDPDDDRATLSHAVMTACDAAGYPTTLAIPSVSVTVADDETPAVTDTQPTFGEARAPAQRYVQGKEIEPLALPAATGGNPPLAYTLSPDLPEGLAWTPPGGGTTGGTIAGTPAAVQGRVRVYESERWLRVDVSGEAWTARLSVAGAGKARTHRLRVGAEGAREFALGGASLTPSVELGMLFDGGDGKKAAGLELGGGVEYAHPGLDLGAELAGRVLVARGSGAREWSMGGSLQLAPASGLGLWLRVAPSYGEAGRWSGQWTPGSDRPLSGPRLETEMGYGLAALAGVVTPYGGLGLSGDGTHGLRLGARWRVEPAFEWELEGERRVGRNPRPGYGLMLRGRMRW